jgi:hypothetical protein
MPDEILRTDNAKCLVLLRGQKPLMLDKITPEEFPVFEKLKFSRITEYIPPWREQSSAREKEREEREGCGETPSARTPKRTAADDADERPAQIAFEDLRNAENGARDKGGTVVGDTKSAGRIASPEAFFKAGYPKAEYSRSLDEDAESTEAADAAQNETPGSKYGALKPVEISPADIKDKGISLQECEEE